MSACPLQTPRLGQPRQSPECRRLPTGSKRPASRPPAPPDCDSANPQRVRRRAAPARRRDHRRAAPQPLPVRRGRRSPAPDSPIGPASAERVSPPAPLPPATPAATVRAGHDLAARRRRPSPTAHRRRERRTHRRTTHHPTAKLAAADRSPQHSRHQTVMTPRSARHSPSLGW